MQLLDSFQQLCYCFLSLSLSHSLPLSLCYVCFRMACMLSFAINTDTHRHSKKHRDCVTQHGIEILVRQLKYVLYFFFFFFLFFSPTLLFFPFLSLCFPFHLRYYRFCLPAFVLAAATRCCLPSAWITAGYTLTITHTDSPAHTHLHTYANNKNLHKNKMKYEQGKGKNRTNPNTNRREKAINMQ